MRPARNETRSSKKGTETVMSDSNNNVVQPQQPVGSAVAADAFPADFGPKPPEGFSPRGSAVLVRPRSPTHAQLVAAPMVIDQVRMDASFSKRFGSAAPDGSVLADALMAACGWSRTAKNVVAYLEYVRIQQRQAWTYAWLLLDAFQPVFLAALAADASIGTMYPALKQFYSIRSDINRRSAAKRKANAKTKTAQDKPAASSSPSASSPATADNLNHGGSVTSTTQKSA